jgi:hypothetical protein
MRQSFKLSSLSITALLFGGTAFGQQPPDVVQSDGWANTAMGNGALLNLTPNSCVYCGIENTAAGDGALNNNTSGGGNVAMGFLAMQFNISGHNNTAVGDSALQWNTSGYYNTAFGSGALLRSTTAYNNTGIGLDALVDNSTGGNNTATGANALFSNTTGDANTASGYLALYSNTTGSFNTATGNQALHYNIDGIRNTASGDWGLYSNTQGNDNTASGQGALYSNTTGSGNIGLGANAGYNVTSGSENIEIGNTGTSSDNGIIRIGAAGSQKATYIAGIENAKVTGAAVYVTSSGQLGVLASSERYKTDIAPMATNTDRLLRLRPVSFHLRTDPNGPTQYGLIAEEVAKVYPELVIRDEAGKIQGVRYDELAPMLLNEVQKQQQVNSAQAAKIAALERQLAGIQAALVRLQPKDELVAQR